MDAFAVSIGKGLTVTRVRPVDVIKTALWFGGFQALFPLLGFFAANTFSKYVTAVDHWIIFALLAFIGGNMIREAFGEEEENSRETAQFDWRHMLPLAVACSISVVTGTFSTVGLYIGRVFGARWQKPAQIAGGAVLVLLGLKVLLEHLGFIAW